MRDKKEEAINVIDADITPRGSVSNNELSYEAGNSFKIVNFDEKEPQELQKNMSGFVDLFLRGLIYEHWFGQNQQF